MRRIDKIVYNLFILSGVFFISILGFSQSKRSKKTFRGKFLNSPHTLIVPDSTTWSEMFSMVSNEYPNNAQQLTFGGGVVQFIYANTTNPLNLAIEGTLIIEATDTFALVAGINFYNNSGAHIINHGKFYAINNNFSSCGNYLWRGITNHNWIGLRGNLIEDAHKALEIKDQTQNTVQQNRFIDNLYGVYSSLNTPSSATFINDKNYLSNPNTLLPLNATENYPRAIAGYYFRDFGLAKINPAVVSNSGTIFEELNCGIASNNCNLEILNCKFQNIQPQYFTQYGIIDADVLNYCGSGVSQYSGNFNLSSIKIKPYMNTAYNTTFYQCRIGVKLSKSDAEILKVGFSEVGTAIEGANFANNILKLRDNRITARRYGINLNLLDDVVLLEISDNNFQMLNGSISGITAKANSNNTGLMSNIIIQNNVLIMNNGERGIATRNLYRPKIKDNKVNRNVIYPTNSNWIAYSIEANRRAEISCNQANLLQAPQNSFIGKDFFISQSSNTKLDCNKANGRAFKGIEFTGNCSNSTITENTIGDQRIGLYYSNNANVGPQPSGAVSFTPGNQWTGSYANTYNNAPAVNENIGSIDNINQDLLQLNRIRIKGTEMGESVFYPENYPDNFSGATNSTMRWFNTNSFDPLTLCVNSSCGVFNSSNGVGTGGNNPVGGGMVEFVLPTQAVVATEYNAETRWAMQKELMHFLMKNPEFIQQNDTLYQFYYGEDFQNLKRLLLVSDTINDATIQASLNNSIRMHNDSLIETLTDSISYFMVMALDSLQAEYALSHMEQLKEDLILLTNFNAMLHNQYKQSRNELMIAALSENENIVPRNYNEMLEKTVNNIYLSTFGVGIDTLSQENKNILEQIIHLCPQAGGIAVYRARAIYAMINDSMVYNDSIVCRNVGYFRQAMQELEENLNVENPINKLQNEFSLTLFPNPTKQELNLNFDLPFKGLVTITDAMGKTIHKHTITHELNTYKIDVRRLSSGLYYLYLSNDKIMVNKKFIKQ